jgi:ribosome-binding factor A
MSEHRRSGRDRRDRRARHDRAAPLESIYFGQGQSPTAARSDDDRRARQLCRQVREQLELALGELEDPLLDGVHVLDVTSVGNGVLRVELGLDAEHSIDAVRERLNAVRGRLRSETAAAISRKRTPMLELVVIPTGAWRRETEDPTDEP